MTLIRSLGPAVGSRGMSWSSKAGQAGGDPGSFGSAGRSDRHARQQSGGSVHHPRKNRGWRQDAGAAAVEFALVALILFALIFGIIAFGIALFNQQGAVQAAREAARKASLGIATEADCQAALKAGRDAVGSAESSFSGMDITIADNSYQKPLLVNVRYKLDFSAIGWLPGIPNRLNLTQTAHAAIEVGHSGVTGTICSWSPS